MKTRKDSKLGNLPKSDQDRVFAWLNQPPCKSIAEVRQLLRTELSIILSEAAISKWNSAEIVRRKADSLLDQVRSGHALTQQLKAEFGEHPPPEIDLLISLLRTLVLQLAAKGQADPAMLGIVQQMMRPVMDWAKLQLQRDSLTLDQARYQRDTCELFIKWAADARAQEIASSTASNADKIEALGQAMFGPDWRGN